MHLRRIPGNSLRYLKIDRESIQNFLRNETTMLVVIIIIGIILCHASFFIGKTIGRREGKAMSKWEEL